MVFLFENSTKLRVKCVSFKLGGGLRKNQILREFFMFPSTPSSFLLKGIPAYLFFFTYVAFCSCCLRTSCFQRKFAFVLRRHSGPLTYNSSSPVLIPIINRLINQYAQRPLIRSSCLSISSVKELCIPAIFRTFLSTCCFFCELSVFSTVLAFPPVTPATSSPPRAQLFLRVAFKRHQSSS